MDTNTTSLPPREKSAVRRFLKSLETRVKQWRRRRQTARQGRTLVRAAAGIDVARLAARMPDRPPLPLVCVVDAFDARLFERCLRSVAGQCYANWRLELVVRTSGCERVESIVRHCAFGPDRVRVTALDDAEWTVAGAMRRGVLACPEGVVVCVGCQDVLTSDALLWIASTVDRRPAAAWIYADEAGICDDGEITDFHYKPDFSWLYLLARFFTGVFCCGRRELLVRCLPDEDSAGNAYYDLALRLSETVDSGQIVHVPQVLSFSRVIDERSAAARQRAQDHCRSVEAALVRRGIRGQVRVHPRCHLLHEFQFAPQALPKVTVIIPTRNAGAMVTACVRSLRAATRYPHYEIVVIDHESDEPELLEFLAEQSAQGLLQVVPYRGRFNFADMNNRAVAATTGDLILFLNNDVDGFSDGWLEQLVATLQLDERIGAVGSLLYYPDGAVQHAGIFFGLGKTGRHGHIDLPHDALGYCGRLRSLQEVSALTGALLLVRRNVFEQLGGFDVKYPEDYNDTDLCLRLRDAGYRCVYTPHVTAFHYSRKTRRTKPGNRETILAQWGAALLCDPFYNPHLSRQRFELGELQPLWEAQKAVDLEACLNARHAVADDTR